jgi:hypothetical protein
MEQRKGTFDIRIFHYSLSGLEMSAKFGKLTCFIVSGIKTNETKEMPIQLERLITLPKGFASWAK